MNKHLDPVHRVYIDLDKVDKAELYNNYAELVEKYRECHSQLLDMLVLIDEQVEVHDMYDGYLDDLNAAKAFIDNPDNLAHASPVIKTLIVGADGRALREENDNA